MAHIPPSSAIFSPSVARAAASTAKDWNYVDSWLQSRLSAHGRSHVPSFERNPDTLRALLALASLNESADEQRDLVARADALALQELRDHRDGRQEQQGTLQDEVLAALEAHLPREGAAALDALAATAVQLGAAYPDPAALGAELVDLQAQIYGLEQMSARVGLLQRHVEAELAQAEVLLREVQTEAYRPPAHMAKQNLELQRQIKAAVSKLPDLRDRALALAHSVGMPSPTIQQVRLEEEAYLDLLAQKKDLVAQIRSFQGLPPDPDQARRELEALRAELRSITERRDAVFEGLVERETPRKPRR
ncbi:uncharacterized protein E0L32_009203 [Thyridium curvatum]|uniref:HAUS augmin-like complex subunit 1 n=1 Tax=Thyridium curvatum TaxID=1093900 RepID=A0A507AJJ7_9PEZI|nr:uncharacterized protein E0L32_009203 [Thyridium curvatum]TPX09602.1 hypothetical protein E0L32_009203 [Thyridium curvatum]